MSSRPASPAKSTTPQPAKTPMAQPATPQSPAGQAQQGQVPAEKIAMRAYEKWCERGCPHGTDQNDWYEAEQELKAEMARGQDGKSGTAQPAPQKAQQRR